MPVAPAEPLLAGAPAAGSSGEPASSYVGGDWRQFAASPLTHAILAFEYQARHPGAHRARRLHCGACFAAGYRGRWGLLLRPRDQGMVPSGAVHAGAADLAPTSC